MTKMSKMREAHAVSETGVAPEDDEGHGNYSEPGFYELRIKGHLDDQWAAWFEGMTLKLQDNGDTLLTGRVIDQAALHGLLRKVRDLGMPLISLTGTEVSDPAKSKRVQEEQGE